MSGDSDILRNIYNLLMESRYWPLERIREYQQTQLAHLLRHARANVPFYKERLDAVFRKDGSIDWSRWREVPILSRETLRDNFEALRSTSVPPGHGKTAEFSTSGSSGTPVRIITTSLASIANQAAVLRLFTIQGLDLKSVCGVNSSLSQKGAAFPEPFRLSTWGASWLSGEPPGKRVIIKRELSPTERLEIIRQHGVRFLIEITNNVEVLARTNLTLAQPVTLDVVMCIGQRISPALKQLLKKSFGARAISIYSSKEGGTMGYECSEGDRYHVSSEIVLIETVDRDGNTCKPGEPGRIIITPFLSTALPLIRYDQGDMGELGGNCSCGCQLPILANISGRSDDLLNLPNGQRHVGTLFFEAMHIDEFALSVQIAQTGPTTLELRYVPKPDAGGPRRQDIVDYFRQHLHADIELVFRPMNEIPKNAGGKQQRVVRVAG